MNGKAEAASGAPTCESGLTLFRSAAQADLFYFAAIVRCDRSPRSAAASVGRTAIVCCDRRTQASDALRSFVAIGGREHWLRRGRLLRSADASVGRAAVGYGIAGRAHALSPFLPVCGKLLGGVLRRVASRTAFCGAYRGKSWPADIFFEFLKKCEK